MGKKENEIVVTRPDEQGLVYVTGERTEAVISAFAATDYASLSVRFRSLDDFETTRSDDGTLSIKVRGADAVQVLMKALHAAAWDIQWNIDGYVRAVEEVQGVMMNKGEGE